MEKLTQITFEVTDEQFERLDHVGIFDQAGILFQNCRIMAASGDGRPIKEKLRDELRAALKEK